MKKLKNQTGLAKRGKKPSATARKESSEKAGKSSSVKAGKVSSGNSGKGSSGKAKRKQGGKGKPYQPKSWEAYSPKGPNATNYTREELEQVVRRASGAANRRLKRLEDAGETRGVYKRALGMLETQGRTKFSGAVKSMSRTELIAEFIRLRDFLSAKTSTKQGIADWKRNVYQSLLDRGFTGSQSELSELFDKYMTKELENALGSDVVYTLLQTEEGRSFLQRAQDALERAKKTGEDPKKALSHEFNISTEEQAGQILAMYFGG